MGRTIHWIGSRYPLDHHQNDTRSFLPFLSRWKNSNHCNISRRIAGDLQSHFKQDDA